MTAARCRWALALALALTLALLGAPPGAEAAARPGAEQDGRDPLAGDDGLPDALDDDDDHQLQLQESRNVRPRAFPGAPFNALTPGGFRPAPAAAAAASLAELAGYERVEQRVEQRAEQRPAAQRARLREKAEREQQQQEEEEEEREREEPDRLALLLRQSRFECAAKPGGYYADEELNCEVFHYCQDGVKHSWICPDGFTFHQVHLICMPPSQDSICQQSGRYHFINDYLYRPINEEEKARRPDLPLRYADRFYPADVHDPGHRDAADDADDEADAEQERRPRPRPAARPAATVFRSAEEVNIPLGQRRPHPQQQQQQQRPYEFDF